MKQYPKEDICCAILAGGKGRRLGGFDKGLLEKNGLPFIAHIRNLLEPQVGKVIINANRHLETYRQYGEVITDELSDFQGPLSGMYTVMRRCNLPWIVSVPCDGIMLPEDLVARLYHDCIKSKTLISVAHDGDRLQPVHAIIHCSLSSSLGTFLTEGNRKIDLWYSQHGYAKSDFSDYPQMFKNINTPADKQAYGV